MADIQQSVMSRSPQPGKTNILGCEVSRVDMPLAVGLTESFISSCSKHQVVVLSVDSLMNARRDENFLAIVNEASLALPDGVPLLWASRLLGSPIPGRVAGSDFLLEFSGIAAARGFTFFLIGGQPGVPEDLARVLVRLNPKLKVVGTYAPPYHREFPSDVNKDIVRRINEAKPDVLWVGLGAPKQERWIHDNLDRLEVRVAVGVGAAFDICRGHFRRAPLWMRRNGLEWLFRFILEPRRLFKRYFIHALPFFPLLLWQMVWDSSRRKRNSY
jgi:N-acetylglucosaminyldiphosphoundecaprenol N-acetyl-beta-D-mannosaminyltransferase